MGKRRLRNCPNCGVRHGPPTGKGRSRLAEDFERRNEEMAGAAENAEDDAGASGAQVESIPVVKSQDQVEWTFPEYPNSEVGSADESTLKKSPFTGLDNGQYGPPLQEQGPARQSSGWGGPAPSREWERAYQQQNPLTASRFGENMSERMAHMENVMGHMVGIQQSQFDQIIKLAKSFPAPPQPAAGAGRDGVTGASANQEPASHAERIMAQAEQTKGQSAAGRGASVKDASQSAAAAGAASAGELQLPPPSWVTPQFGQQWRRKQRRDMVRL